MPAPTLTIEQILDMNPCEDRFAPLFPKLPQDSPITAAQAVEAGATLDDLLWVIVESDDADLRRRARMFAADCAARVLHVFEAARPGDMRPRKAILAAREARVSDAARDAARDAAWAADARLDDFCAALVRDADAMADGWSAARDVDAMAAGWSAAMAAEARAAGWSAAMAAVARDAAWAAGARAAVRGARAAVMAAEAMAAGWSAAMAAGGAGAAEREWQLTRLLVWLSDVEPEPLPLPEMEAAE